MIRRRWKSSITNCKTFPGADCDTDHILLVAKICVKLSRNRNKPRSKKIDVKKLDNPEIRAQFTETTEQCFKEYLSKADNDQAEEISESLWLEYKAILSETADQVLGKCKRQPKKPWISSQYHSTSVSRGKKQP